jgi:class 3 adenylate cyclase
VADRDKIIRHLKTEIAALETRLGDQNSLLASLRAQLQDHEAAAGDERRTQIFRRAAIDMVPYHGHLREFSEDDASSPGSDLGEALIALGSRLDHKFAEIKALSEITSRVNSGMFFDDVMDHVFENFESLIPFDRIGIALVDRTESGKTLARARWHRAKYDGLALKEGFAAILSGSTLETIASSRTPRIINDLAAYLEDHPTSASTRLIRKEGIMSSLTCPLVAGEQVIGFIFFSSLEADTYRDQHIELFSQIAGELALTLEKGRAYEDLYLRNEFIRKVFGQYVTNEVAEAALKNNGPLALGGERRRVTILMADLRGFTPMSETLSPEEVVDALNLFLGTMTSTIMKYGGSIDNFIGDALMAVFGIPEVKSDDVERAVACAVEMQNAMTTVNAMVDDRGLPPLAMGIGLSTGEVVAGNIGSDLRLKYSVIGATVNLAARIEGLAAGGQIFASNETHAAVEAIVQSAGHLSVQLKGFAEPVPVYEITGIGGAYNLAKSAKA